MVTACKKVTLRKQSSGAPPRSELVQYTNKLPESLNKRPTEHKFAVLIIFPLHA